jgi:hypothetical protein
MPCMVQVEELVTEVVAKEIAMAILPSAAIVSGLVDDERPDQGEFETLVWDVVRREMNEHLAAQSAWPTRTDSDRLREAFQDLNRFGIVARENFGLCQDCGISEIDAEVTSDQSPRGYAFYHRQDAYRAVKGDELLISYGSFNPRGGASAREISHDIEETLLRHGLKVRGAKATTERIGVDLTWRRRRMHHLAALPLSEPTVEQVVLDLIDPWPTVYPPLAGIIPAGRLAGLYLPWLPAETRVRIFAGGQSMIVRRDRQVLLGEFDGAARQKVVVDRHHGLALIDHLTGGTPPDLDAPAEPELLEVLYDHPFDHAHRSVPLTLTESLDLVRTMPWSTSSWISFNGSSHSCAQISWDCGRVWLETPDPTTRTSVGKYASLDDVSRVLETLAREDRVVVADLLDAEIVAWG